MDIIFTEHAKDRIKRRKITEDEIINTIKYPKNLIKRNKNIMLRRILVEEE